MMEPFARRYDAWVLGRPLLVLLALALALGFFVWQARDFRLDASADSLLMITICRYFGICRIVTAHAVSWWLR
jgi:hypothetical protein